MWFIISWVSHSSQVTLHYCFMFSVMLNFSLIVPLNKADDWSDILLWHLKTCASGQQSPCDWGRETFLWHATKICPREWVIKGFWEGAVSKNEYQQERIQHMRRFSGSAHPGSYSQRQLFKHCFAWLYLWNNAAVQANRSYLGYKNCISGLCQKCYPFCHMNVVVTHHVAPAISHSIQFSSI